MSVEGKIDILTGLIKDQSKKIDLVDDKIKKINTVLGGSGLGDKGIISQFNEYKDSHHKLKRNVRDQNIVTRVLTGVLGGMVAAWEFIKTSF
tara:strand:+ start:5975 stop:6250 length:276 start_codon:yes stop_codon:yes gene_type:complete